MWEGSGEGLPENFETFSLEMAHLVLFSCISTEMLDNLFTDIGPQQLHVLLAAEGRGFRSNQSNLPALATGLLKVTCSH